MSDNDNIIRFAKKGEPEPEQSPARFVIALTVHEDGALSWVEHGTFSAIDAVGALAFVQQSYLLNGVDGDDDDPQA